MDGVFPASFRFIGLQRFEQPSKDSVSIAEQEHKVLYPLGAERVERPLKIRTLLKRFLDCAIDLIPPPQLQASSQSECKGRSGCDEADEQGA